MLIGILLAGGSGGGCGGLPGRELLSPARFVPLRRAEAIVVLGNRPPVDAEGRVLPETERRVRRGVALFLAGWAPRLVVTGGRSPGLERSEAEVMAALAARLGVPEEAILLEPEARDTAENARNTVSLLCAGRAGGSARACRPEVILVSSPYHLERARRLFGCAGAEVQVAGTEIPEDPGYRSRFTAYEYGARLGGRFANACARAHGPGPGPGR